MVRQETISNNKITGDKLMKSQVFTMIASVLMAGLIIAGSACAQSRNPSLDETVTLRLGPLWAGLEASVKAFGQDLTVDENIDVSDVDFSVYGLWRITPQWHLEAGYSGIDKSAGDTLDNSVTLGSITVPAGVSLAGSLETSVLRLAVGYAFLRSESYEFGVDLGINFTSVKESFRATIPGIAPVSLTTLDVTEPLPTVGLFYNYAFSEKLYLTSRAGLFAFDIGEIDGTIFDVFGGIEYRPWEHVGFGAAYTYTSADLTITDRNVKTDIEYDYYGPLLYVVVGF
jgi:hypothetical protein